VSKQGGNQHGQAAGAGRVALRGRRCFILLGSIAAAGLLLACPEPTQARAWPEGTLLAVDEIPISSEELAADVATIVLIEPQWNDTQLKRLAFNSIALPRALARARATAEARDKARAELDVLHARMLQDRQFGPPTSAGVLGQERAGSWMKVGPVAWGAAFQLQPGEWSEVLEEPGAFLRVRLLERLDAPVPAAVGLRLDVLAVPFGDALSSKPPDDEELGKHRLTIVDPKWEAIVPERTKYLMKVGER